MISFFLSPTISYLNIGIAERRASIPGIRVYAKNTEIPKVLNGLGIAIISTSRGVMTDKEARKQNLGGEVLAYIW